MSNGNCTILSDNLDKVDWMSPHMTTKMSRASILMLLNAILMGVVVVIGACAPRYRRNPVTGVLFLGATALFLPIVSVIVTTTGSLHDLIIYALENVECYDRPHLYLVFLWTGVVIAIGTNTSAVVAGDAREGRNISPPIILLVKASWWAYLTFSTLGPTFDLVQLFVIMFAKLVFKYAAFYTARRSFALGRSPRLIAGYMGELQHDDKLVHAEHTAPPTCPALIVTGEDNVKVEQQPHGYNLKQMAQGETARANGLVTLDRVWGLDGMDILKISMGRRPIDLCFSFALFKILRCRFAKYTDSEAGIIKTSKFFREALLRGGDDHYETVFGIITDELSFIHDYYFSSLPINYSDSLFPAMGITLSLWSIGYCLYLVVSIALREAHIPGQIHCILVLETTACGNDDAQRFAELLTFGNWYFDAVPFFLAIAVLVLAETREIVSYCCSNWTKVALICHHVNRACWQRSRVVQKCICCLLKYRRCKLFNNWDDRMKQCSILVLRPRKSPLVLRRLLRFLDRGKKVKVPNTVKAAIFEKLKGESFTITEQEDGAVWYIRPPSSPVPASLYGCSGRQPAYTILVWHIATSVFEVSQLPQLSSDHKTVATHLSRYCAYLVSSRPELLPDDAEWCRNLHDEVKKDADRVLASVQGREYYYHDQLVRVLGADSNHEVLRNGARLGKKLAEDPAMGWEALASFWVEMVLYVAPSENLEGHAEAISHGGELVTLLWAMLAHAGIIGRLDAADVACRSC